MSAVTGQRCGPEPGTRLGWRWAGPHPRAAGGLLLPRGTLPWVKAKLSCGPHSPCGWEPELGSLPGQRPVPGRSGGSDGRRGCCPAAPSYPCSADERPRPRAAKSRLGPQSHGVFAWAPREGPERAQGGGSRAVCRAATGAGWPWPWGMPPLRAPQASVSICRAETGLLCHLQSPHRRRRWWATGARRTVWHWTAVVGGGGTGAPCLLVRSSPPAPGHRHLEPRAGGQGPSPGLCHPAHCCAPPSRGVVHTALWPLGLSLPVCPTCHAHRPSTRGLCVVGSVADPFVSPFSFLS